MEDRKDKQKIGRIKRRQERLKEERKDIRKIGCIKERQDERMDKSMIGWINGRQD